VESRHSPTFKSRIWQRLSQPQAQGDLETDLAETVGKVLALEEARPIQFPRRSFARRSAQTVVAILRIGSDGKKQSDTICSARQHSRRKAAPLRDSQTFGDMQFRRNRFTPTADSMVGKMNRLCRPMESPAKNFFLTGHF
jgi:hypothetical protein